jgi:aspartate aminotransferase
MTRAARRFAAIEESATFAVLHAVHRLRSQGVSVVDLGGGEPCFGTADHVIAAAATALNGGFTHYTPSAGLAELRQAIAAKLDRDNDVSVDPATEVIVTPSAKHAVFVAMLAILDPGDDVLIPAPHWVSYPAMAHMVGARPVAVPTAPDFRITREALEAHLTPPPGPS